MTKQSRGIRNNNQWRGQVGIEVKNDWQNFKRSEMSCKCGCGFDWADIAYTVAIPLLLLGGSL